MADENKRTEFKATLRGERINPDDVDTSDDPVDQEGVFYDGRENTGPGYVFDEKESWEYNTLDGPHNRYGMRPEDAEKVLEAIGLPLEAETNEYELQESNRGPYSHGLAKNVHQNFPIIEIFEEAYGTESNELERQLYNDVVGLAEDRDSEQGMAGRKELSVAYASLIMDEIPEHKQKVEEALETGEEPSLKELLTQ